MEFLLGGAIISGVTWLMNGGLDGESTASQERFEATARKSQPRTADFCYVDGKWVVYKD